MDRLSTERSVGVVSMEESKSLLPSSSREALYLQHSYLCPSSSTRTHLLSSAAAM